MGDTDKAIQTAALRWNAKGTLFSEDAPGLVPDVTIKRHWYKVLTNKCGSWHALACVKQDGSQDYPHLGGHTMYINYPPKGKNNHGLVTRWTNFLGIARDTTQNDVYYYTPHIIMHELGHVMGLGHYKGAAGTDTHVMGGYRMYHPVVAPSPNDRHGTAEVRRAH